MEDVTSPTDQSTSRECAPGSSNLCIAAATPATSAEWDATWRACSYSTYFHSRAWAELWSRYTHRATAPRPERIEFSDGRRAVLPISVRRTAAGGTEATLSPMGTFGGWLSTDELSAEHVALLVQSISNREGGLCWRWNPFASPVVEVAGASLRQGETSAIDLRDGPEAAFRRWRKGHRAAAKQAERCSVSVRCAESAADWEAYYRLYNLSLERWGDAATSRYERSLFQLLSAEGRANATLWIAERSGRPIAGAVCLYAPNHAVYWHGAADDAEFSARPVHRLIFEMSRAAAERGCQWLDLNPSGDLESVAHFKRGFGPQVLPAPVITKADPSAAARWRWRTTPVRAANWLRNVAKRAVGGDAPKHKRSRDAA